MTAPIVLFVYNRPDHLLRTIESLKENKEAQESLLFIFSDGPKNHLSAPNVAAVRAYIKTIEGFRAVTVVEREQNWGLAKSIIAGVSEITERYGKAIVLEDDLIFSKYFLRYMNKALELYEPYEKVMHVSGHMFQIKFSESVTDSFLLPITGSIGWGTWRRAWRLLDEDMGAGQTRILADSDLRFRFNLNGTYPYSQMVKNQLKGKVDSWAIKWYLSFFLNDGLGLQPKRSLIRHIGFDREATHAKGGKDFYADTVAESPIAYFPDVIAVDSVAYDNLVRRFANEKRRRESLKYRLAEAFRRIAWIQ